MAALLFLSVFNNVQKKKARFIYSGATQSITKDDFVVLVRCNMKLGKTVLKIFPMIMALNNIPRCNLTKKNRNAR